MAKNPSRIDLLELDIDLRLTDLWREAGEITEWNLDVVAAFMRAAYGKGYCDALTEDAPGSLCHDHGSRIPVVVAAASSASACAQKRQLLTCASSAANRLCGSSRVRYFLRLSP
jgi:hypothetical protein